MLKAELFALGIAFLCRRCLFSIAFLVLLTSCSFHSAQLNFVQGVLKELSAEKATVYYWKLKLPGEALKAVPIIQSDRLFFSDGEEYLISIGFESVAEIKALDTGIVQKFAAKKANDVERLVAGTLARGEPGQTRGINESNEDDLAFDGGLILHSHTLQPDSIYFCSKWVYRSDKKSSHKLCENRKSGAMKFTHFLDDLGGVKRINVMLDGQLLIDLERTGDLISY